MPKRTLGVLGVAAFAGLALPFGMPQSAAATGPAYNSIFIKPVPLEQPGTLSPTGTNTVTACVRPLSSTGTPVPGASVLLRSEEHTSELQSLRHLVCRLLLEKKK